MTAGLLPPVSQNWELQCRPCHTEQRRPPRYGDREVPRLVVIEIVAEEDSIPLGRLQTERPEIVLRPALGLVAERQPPIPRRQQGGEQRQRLILLRDLRQIRRCRVEVLRRRPAG